MYYLQQYIEKTLRAAAILYSGEPTITIEIIDHGKKALEKIYGLVFDYMRKKNVEPTSFPILDTIKSEENGNYFHQIACWYSQAKYPCDSTVDKNIKKIQQSLKKHAEQTVISYANLPERYTTKYNSSSNVSNSNATEHQEQEAQKNTVDDMPEPDFHPKFAEAGSILGVVDADTYDKVCLFTNQFQEAFQKHIFKPLVKFLSSEKRNSLPEKDKKLIHFLSETSIVLDPKNVNTIPELDFNADIKGQLPTIEVAGL